MALNAAAHDLGVLAGEPLADARARHPGLLSDAQAPGEEVALLAALADWCDRYTPLVALDGGDGLLLDITGCAHLFARTGNEALEKGMLPAGERALMRDCLRRLNDQGFAVRAAVADTPAAAWALARHAPERSGLPGTSACEGVPPGKWRDALAPLPMAALRLEETTIDALARVGLTRVCDVIDRPRGPLASRFGRELVRRIDRLRGDAAEPISPRLAVPLLAADRRFFEPISREEDVRGVILGLAERLSGDLERRGEGGRAFELALFRVDGVVNRVTVGTSRALRDPKRVLGLFAEKLAALGDDLDAGFGFDLVRLCVLEAQRFEASQADFSQAGEQTEALDVLIDRLGARLGIARVARFLPCDSHLPEARQKLVPAALVDATALVWCSETPEAPDTPQLRPLRLIDPPESVDAVAMVPEGPPLRFRWRRALYEVRACEGPERLVPPWWQSPQPPQARDYYRVEDGEGRRFWLYREGFYDVGSAPDGAPPRWFLQGLYA
ncbi:protein ImuB [Stappia sp. ES.058]|nr:protein ImuB [Stappia sp. ES.058]